MKKILILVGALFLSLVNTTAAIAPTHPQEILNWQPINLLDFPVRAQPKLLTPPAIVVYAKTAAGAKAYALDKLGRTQFNCIDKLFTKESNWRTFARNSSSGAYGIPQALPGSKMATSGSDWRTNPITQVKWGIKYVKARYGSACGAWRHSQLYGWY